MWLARQRCAHGAAAATATATAAAAASGTHACSAAATAATSACRWNTATAVAAASACARIASPLSALATRSYSSHSLAAATAIAAAPSCASALRTVAMAPLPLLRSFSSGGRRGVSRRAVREVTAAINEATAATELEGGAADAAAEGAEAGRKRSRKSKGKKKAESAESRQLIEQQQLFVTQLQDVAERGGSAAEAAEVAGAVAAGGVAWSADLLTAWLQCLVRTADCDEAERVWDSMATLNDARGVPVSPAAHTYAALMCVYLASGTAHGAQQAQRVHDDMLQDRDERGKLLKLTADDYDDLISAATSAGLTDVAEQFTQRAQADGGDVWTELESLRNPQQRAHNALRTLSQLAQRYMESYPVKNAHVRGSMHDITLKSSWRTMRAQAIPALDELLQLVRSNGYGLAWLDWKQVLHVLKHYHLYDYALPFYRAVQAQFDARIDAWRAEEEERVRAEAAQQPVRYDDEGKVLPAEEAPAPAAFPPELCMPYRCINMLLECVVKSAPAAPAGAPAAEGDAAPDAGLATTAEELLAEMTSPEHSVKFQWGATSPWSILLDNLTRAGLSSASPAGALSRARAFYDAIELKAPSCHNVMLGAYIRAGMLDEAEKLVHHLRKDATSRFGSGIAAAQLSLLHAKLARSLEQRGALLHQRQQSQQFDLVLTEAESALMASADQIWSEAKSKPERADAVVVGAVLKLHAAVGNVTKQIEIVAEAIALETAAAAEEGEKKKKKDGKEEEEVEESADSDPAAAGSTAPVLLDSASACLVLNSLATSARPSEHKEAAHDLYLGVVRRYVDLAEGPEPSPNDDPESAPSLLVGSLSPRTLGLFVGESAHNAYFKFLQRAGESEQMLQVWPEIPASEKEGNPRLFVAMLNAAAGAPDGAQRAAELVEEMLRLNVRWDLHLANAWLGCFTRRGEWDQAEAVWARMHPDSGDMRLAAGPCAVSYRELMRTYMAAGEPEQLAKIAALDAEMQSGTGPAGKKVEFQARDYKRLIQAAHRSRLPEQARHWAERARAKGVWEEMGRSCHTIIERIATWENEPKVAVADAAAASV